MTEKRFVDDGFEAIDEQSFTDTETDKTYYVDYFDEIIDLCNELNDENQRLKKELEECKNNKLFSRRELERENKELKYHLNRTEKELKEYKEFMSLG
jgi:cell shape-determining protein MreC